MFKQEQIKTKIIPIEYQDLLKDFANIDITKENDIKLSDTQQTAYNLYSNGKNVLILGSAGVGKSVLIRYIKDNTLHKKIYVTATTGIAAYNISGMTIHSYIGFGTGDGNLEYNIRKVMKNQETKRRIRNTDILIIDEISMLSAELFEKINEILKVVRGNCKLFGGIQVILTGDFFQLLPVFKNKEDTRLLIESDIFLSNFTEKNTIQLIKNYRQENDIQYAELLQRLRKGDHTFKDIELLKSRITLDVPETVIRLVPLNALANRINEVELKKINNTNTKTFIPNFTKDQCKYLRYELERQFKSKNLDILKLKVGARVMLVKNLDVQKGLINGSLGTIKEFSNNFPIVLFDNGIELLIDYYLWELEDTETNKKCEARQLPLILAYAITIHKSQSLTLNKACISLSSCFCDHQVYVALSRLKTINGLFLTDFDENQIKVNEDILNFSLKNK